MRVTKMTDILRGKLKDALDSSGTTATALSRSLKRDLGYIGDFLRGKKGSLSAKDLVDIERHLRLAPGTLVDLTSADAERVAARVLPEIQPNSTALPLFTTRRLPVYGRIIDHLRGAIIMDNNPVDHAQCPAALEGVPNAFAVYVPDDSLAPRYFAGETVFIHPGKPVTDGCFALIQIKGTPPAGLIRRYIGSTADEIEIETYSPQKREFIKKSTILKIERIVSSMES